MAALTYPELITDSNLEPLTAQFVRDDGCYVEFGETATATVSIKDERTGARLVADAACVVIDPGQVSYTLPESVVSRIERDGAWLVEWRVVAQNGRVLRSPQLKLPVRRKL